MIPANDGFWSPKSDFFFLNFEGYPVLSYGFVLAFVLDSDSLKLDLDVTLLETIGFNLIPSPIRLYLLLLLYNSIPSITYFDDFNGLNYLSFDFDLLL